MGGKGKEGTVAQFEIQTPVRPFQPSQTLLSRIDEDVSRENEGAKISSFSGQGYGRSHWE